MELRPTADRSEVELDVPSPTHASCDGRRPGKGAAIWDGVAVARAPVVLFMDADMAVDPLQTPQLVSAMGKADVAIGSRSVPGSSVESDNFRRAVMGQTYSRYVNALTGLGIRDTQCGFKAFHTPAGPRLLFHCMVIDRFAFDVDLLYLARRLNLPRSAEVPIHWRDVDGSAVRPVVDPFLMVLDVLRMRIEQKATPYSGPFGLHLCIRSGESSEDVAALLCARSAAPSRSCNLSPAALWCSSPCAAPARYPERFPVFTSLFQERTCATNSSRSGN